MSGKQKLQFKVGYKDAGRKIFAVVLAFLFMTVAAVSLDNIPQAQATISKFINFQGKLTAVSNGNNVANGTYAFEFKFYTASSGGSPVLTETFDQPSGACSKLTVTNGVFNAKLGSCNTSLASLDFTGGSMYLTVNFAPTGTSYDGEMSPRKQLVSSAYAFVANGVSGDGVINTANQSTTALAVGRTSTNAALQVDTNTASSVTGLKVTSAAAAGGLALATISSGTNENLTLDAKGSGTISINGTATGDVLLAGGSGGGNGCTVTNSNGNFACTGTGTFSNFSGTNTGDVTLTAFGSTPNANGASLSGQALTLQPADGSNPGGVSTTTQTFAGAKTFTSNPIITKADPSLVLNVTTAGDTDYWIGVQDDAGGDDDDLFQIGKGTTPGTTALVTVFNSGGIENNGYYGLSGSAAYLWFQSSTTAKVDLDGQDYLSLSNTTTNGSTFTVDSRSITRTSGNTNTFELIPSFTPTSGTGTTNTIAITPTINQTGTATGITRGLYVNPTITSAKDYRGIDTSYTIAGALSGSTNYGNRIAITNNQTTNVNTVYGQNITFTDAGSLANTLYGQYIDVTTANTADTTYAGVYLGGNVGIGTSTPTEKLAVTDGAVLNSLSSNFSLTNLGGVNISASNFTNTVKVSGKYLYLSNSAIAGTCSGTTLTGCEFSIYDITNPSSPIAVSGIDVGSNTTFTMQGRYVYLLTDTNGGNEIRVYDVSNPSSPTLVGGYDNGVGAAMNYQQGEISGKYLYVGGTNSTDACTGTTLTGCELSIFDISNPAVPVPVGGYNATAWSADLAIQGKYVYQVYVTGNGNEFRIIDVSNPSSPSLVGGVSMGVDGTGIKVSGKYAYIATGNVAGTCSGTTLTGCEFRIYDISNPASPVAVNGMDNGGIYSGKVVLMGNYALVANFFATSGNEIRAYNISNPSAITAAGGFDLAVGTAGFWTLATQGRYVFAAGDGMSGNDLRVYSMAGVDTPAINTGTVQANTLRATEDLQVGGTLTASGGLNIGVGGILSGGPVSIQSATTSSSLFALDIKNSAATQLLVVRDDGNVGIGTASPTSLLSVGSSSQFQVNSSGAIAAATGVTSSGTITFSGLGGGGTKCVQTDNAGVISAAAAACGSGSVRWDQIAAPTAPLSLTMPAGDETTFTVQSTTQTGFLWQSSTLTSGVLGKYLLSGTSSIATPANSGSALTIASTATGWTAATQTLAAVNSSGTNATTGVTIQGLTSTVTNTGTTSKNIAAVFSASGASTNYAIIVPNGGGFVGIGTSTPTVPLHVVSAATTTDVQTIDATGLTTGTGLTINGSSATPGQTDALLKVAGNLGNIGSSSNGLINSTANIKTSSAFDGAANLYLRTNNQNTTNANFANGLYSDFVDNTALANNDTAVSGSITLTGNAAKVGVAVSGISTSSSNTADTVIGGSFGVITSGAPTTGTAKAYGLQGTANTTGMNGGTANVYGVFAQADGQVTSGTINAYGLYVANGSSSTTGTSTKYGLFVESMTGADNNYGAVFQGGNVGVGDITPAALFTVGASDAFQLDNSGVITTASLAGGGTKCLQTDNTGVISAAAAACGSGSGGARLDQITAATGANSIDSLSFGQVWDWSTLNSTVGLELRSTNSSLTAGTVLAADANTSGALTTPLVNFLATGAYTGTGSLLGVSADSTQVSAVARFSGQGLTSGILMDLNAGSSLTTGNILSIAGASYNPGGGNTGKLANLNFTNAATNTAGSTSSVIGLSISPTISANGSGGNHDTYSIRIQDAAGTPSAGNQTIYGMRIGNQGRSGADLTYGLFVDTQSGSTVNYAAAFQGGNVGVGEMTPLSLLTVGNGDRFRIDTNGAVGIDAVPASGDSPLNIVSTTATDYSRLINLSILDDDAEDTNAIYLDNQPAKGTLTSTSLSSYGLFNQFSGTADFAVTSGAVSNTVYGESNIINLGGIVIGSSAGTSANAITYGNYNNISGGVVDFDSDATGTNVVTTAGVYSNVATDWSPLGIDDSTYTTYGAQLLNTATSAGDAAMTANAYGLQAAATGNLTTTGNTVHYGAHLTATGTADTNYGLFVATVSGAANNYAAVFQGGNVGIGNIAPSGLLSVGSSSQLTVNASGNLSTSGTIATTGSGTITSAGLLTASAGLTVSTGDATITAGNLAFGATTRITNAGVGTLISGTVIGSQTFTTNNIVDSGALTIATGANGALTLNPNGTGSLVHTLDSVGNINDTQFNRSGTLTSADSSADILASRTVVTNSAGSLNDTANFVQFTSNISGTGTDTGSVLGVTQSNSSASGAAIAISNAGTGVDIQGTSNTWNVTKAGVASFVTANASTSVVTPLLTNAGAISITTTASNGNISLTPNGTGSIVATSGVTSGTTTTSALSLSANSLTTGTGEYIASSTLSSGILLDLQSNGTAALTNQTGVNVALQGAVTGAQTTYGGKLSNTHTGASAVNVGLQLTASGASGANYALITTAGSVGINTTGPDRVLDVLDASNPQLRLTTTDGTVFADFQNTANANAIVSGSSLTSSSAAQYGLQITPTVNQTLTAGYTALDVNATETATAKGLNKLLDLRVGNSPRFSVRNDGSLTLQDASYITTPYGGYGKFQNLLVRSEEFDNASWTKTSVSAPTADTQTAPDGSTKAESLATSGSGGDVCQFTATAAGSNTFTFSVWVKAASGTQSFGLRIDSSATSCATANTPTGTEQTFTATTTWQRYSVTQVFSGATGNVKPRIFPGTSAGTGTVYAWGAQLDQDSRPSNYVFTGSATLANINQGQTIESNLATASGFTYGSRNIINLNGAISASSTTVGQFIRMIDNATGTNDTATTRALEVQGFSGSNIHGINEGIAAFGYTFGVHAVTTAQANAAAQPAALFADLDNSAAPTQGNAIRAYTNDATSADLVSFYQETSTFTGNGLVMNFGNTGGGFTGNFISLQKGGTESFHIDDDGSTFISLTGSTATERLCWDGSGGTNEEIVDCTGTPGDLAENFGTSDPSIQAADVVVSTGNAKSVIKDGHATSKAYMAKSTEAYQANIIGVISTQPNEVYADDLFDANENPRPVALVGRVPVKVTLENGAIKLGDYITSSATEPGKAMKANRSGMVIGQALSSYNGTGEAQVIVFVKVGFQSIGNTIVLDAPTTQGQDLQSGEEDLTSHNASTFVIQQQAAEGQEENAPVSNILQLQTGDANRFMVSSTGATSILSNLTCDSDESISECPSVLKVTQANTELMNINARGTLTLAGTIFIKDDTFAGSVATDENGEAEITFSYNLGTGKPVVQLTAEAQIPVFAQIKEFKQDEHGNYTGFVIKTFDLISGPIQAIVHYTVVGKEDGYITLGDVTVPTVPDNGSGSGGDGVGLIISGGQVVGGDSGTPDGGSGVGDISDPNPDNSNPNTPPAGDGGEVAGETTP